MDMETSWNTALWRQFGAAIDMLENALVACPASLWNERLWRTPPPEEFPPQFAEFWYVTFHALVWLDLYLSGVPEEEFAPPAPFAQGVLDSAEAAPERPYTKEELHAYLASMRQKCQTTLATLTDEQAQPARRVSLVRGATRQLSGVAPLQYAPRPGTCGPTEPLSRTAHHLGRGPRLDPASAG